MFNIFEIFDLLTGSSSRCLFASKKDTYKLITLDELKQHQWSDNYYNELKAIMQPEDELYFYRSSEKSWCHLAGREGYILKRDGKQINFFLTKMN
jgi:hypothetical protein